MSSGLYRQAYETGKIVVKTDLLIKLLSRRFGLLPVDLQKKISQADQYQLDLIADSIFDFKSADDTLKTFNRDYAKKPDSCYDRVFVYITCQTKRPAGWSVKLCNN